MHVDQSLKGQKKTTKKKTKVVEFAVSEDPATSTRFNVFTICFSKFSI